ncbi:MAG: FkbM family methyltransferase [Blautia sp.]|nr:FkbM family methyltransferase [Blautia sp.]MCM1200762.1 FkbM family methyltransferase [Bacteroides fragilis]
MKNFIQTIDEIQKQADLEKYREIVEKQGRKFVIFGAGDCGHVVYNMLHKVDIEVSFFCDNKAGGHTDEATGLAIVSPEYLKDKTDDLTILICAVEEDAYRAIYEQVMQMGFDKVQIDIMREYYDRLSIEYLEDNMKRYRDAYQLLEDDFSKRVYLARMKKVFLMSDIAEIVSPCEEEYFDEKVILTDEEVFIDCGGFDGDTSVKFLEKCNGKYKDIVIFEPELCKKAAIEKNLAGHSYELYQAGVWSEKTTLYFAALETDGSRVLETESDYKIEAAALDETVYDKKPTFIKMDIEGSEQEALKGCKRILREYKPKLAICVYHRPDDLYKIPFLIKELNPEYQLYLRQYSNTRFETVLYAL